MCRHIWRNDKGLRRLTSTQSDLVVNAMRHDRKLAVHSGKYPLVMHTDLQPTPKSSTVSNKENWGRGAFPRCCLGHNRTFVLLSDFWLHGSSHMGSLEEVRRFHLQLCHGHSCTEPWSAVVRTSCQRQRKNTAAMTLWNEHTDVNSRNETCTSIMPASHWLVPLRNESLLLITQSSIAEIIIPAWFTHAE